MNDRFNSVYARLNDNNKYWVDERLSIILEHVKNPTDEEIKHARELALTCYFKMIENQSASKTNSST